jgi:quercetin dioxygenase-like cupin family protein
MLLRPFRLALVLALSFVIAPMSVGQDKSGDDGSDEGVKTTIEGLVRDIACPIQNHKSTARDFNLKCALDCAKRGSPLAVLTDSGDLYLPTSQQMPDRSVRAQLLPFVGKRVKITGRAYERNGTRSISVERIERLSAPVSATAGLVRAGESSQNTARMTASVFQAEHNHTHDGPPMRVEFENDAVQVVRMVIPPHGKIPMHEVPSARVVILLTDEHLRVTTPDGATKEMHEKAGTATWMEPQKHAGENLSDKPLEFIVVVPKSYGSK